MSLTGWKRFPRLRHLSPMAATLTTPDLTPEESASSGNNPHGVTAPLGISKMMNINQ